MRYGMPYLYECGSVDACSALCRELGLGFVELNMSFPDCTLDRLSPEMLNSLRAKYGIGYTLHLDEKLQPCAYDARIREAYVENTIRAIRLARACGMPTVNLHWERGVYITLPTGRIFIDDKYPEAYERNTLYFRDRCEDAAGGEVTLCVENTDGWLPYQQHAISQLLESPAFALTLDLGHSHAIGDTDLPFYTAHGDRLRHMHAHDCRGQSPHLPFGAGDIDLRGRLEMARSAGASVVLEVKTVEALRDTVQRLSDYDPHCWEE